MLSPASNLTIVQNVNDFTIFNEYYNTLSWSASTDPDLQGYVIYRNGDIIAVVSSAVLQWVDDNRNPSVSDTYGVAAYGSGLDQSITITATYP